MAQTEPNEERQTRPFADFLGQQRRGVLAIELSHEFQDLIEAVTAHNKKGELVLRIKVNPAKEEGRVEITDDVIVKAPTASRPASIFFVDDESNLSREDPRQQTLGLRDVSKPSATGTDGGAE